MQTKKGYVLGIFTGMVLIVLAYIAIGLFFPYLLRGMSNTGANANQLAASTYTIGDKVDEILLNLDRYYVENIDMDQLSDKIYRGVVSLLEDPYTSYFDPEQFVDFMEDTEGIYAGIGVSVSANLEKNIIEIVAPFEGYPGANAGMLPGDAIVKVNGTDFAGEQMSEAVNMMKGEAGTSVEITIYRESTDEYIDMTVVREIINVPTVYHKMLDKDIGYLRITQFDRVTTEQFIKAYHELKDLQMKGMILDLRNNPGGLLDVVCEITDLLVPEGTITYTEDKYGKRKYTPSDSTHIEVPLLVLVNGSSASASEVLSGAVKDLGVGELVGTTTFGKGLVQSIYTITDQSAIKITIAKYYTPSGVCIQGTGIAPDYEIDMEPELSVRIQQLTLEEDVQLNRAVEIMNEKIAQ